MQATQTPLKCFTAESGHFWEESNSWRRGRRVDTRPARVVPVIFLGDPSDASLRKQCASASAARVCVGQMYGHMVSVSAGMPLKRRGPESLRPPRLFGAAVP